MPMVPAGQILLDLMYFRRGMIKSRTAFIIFVYILLLVSCDFNFIEASPVVIEGKQNTNSEVEIPENSFTEREWNILIYMSADNNLESAALEDICELETSKLDVNKIGIFVLLDRSVSYDTSEGNWSGTRLYRLQTGRTSFDKKMISEQIECPDLGLYLDSYTKLDMSSSYVLSKTINFINSKYPANKSGLIMWGHGTGWRSCESQLEKGFAYSETSKTYMTLKQLGQGVKNGLEGRRFDFIGFDTCFGGELEVVYELKDCADYFCGSEGLVMASGWDYTSLFNMFQRCDKKTAQNLCLCVNEQFKKQYGNTKRASIVSVNMDYVSTYFATFEKCSAFTADLINSRQIRNDLIGALFSNANRSSEIYTYGSEKSDVYMDVSSIVNVLADYFPEELEQLREEFRTAENQLIISSWASDRDKGGLGVLFATFSEINVLSTIHPSGYIRGTVFDQISFVNDSKGYVPSKDLEGSLLDKLFYFQF